MDCIISHVVSPYLLLIKAEERLFFTLSACAAKRTQALSLGEAEGNFIVYPFSNPFLLCRDGSKLAEFTPSSYETAHRLDVTMVITKL
jgi:hypothetical protein